MCSIPLIDTLCLTAKPSVHRRLRSDSKKEMSHAAVGRESLRGRTLVNHAVSSTCATATRPTVNSRTTDLTAAYQFFFSEVHTFNLPLSRMRAASKWTENERPDRNQTRRFFFFFFSGGGGRILFFCHY